MTRRPSGVGPALGRQSLGNLHPLLAALVAANSDALVAGDKELLALRDRYPIETLSEIARRSWPSVSEMGRGMV